MKRSNKFIILLIINLIRNLHFFARANLESDTNVTDSVISATSVSGLTPINLNSNPAKTRRSAIAGAYYDVAENQRIGLLGIYRQEPSQSESSTTAIATYHIGM